MADQNPRPAHFVQSLERGLAVIRAFDTSTPELTLSDVDLDLARCGGPRSAAGA